MLKPHLLRFITFQLSKVLVTLTTLEVFSGYAIWSEYSLNYNKWSVFS